MIATFDCLMRAHRKVNFIPAAIFLWLTVKHKPFLERRNKVFIYEVDLFVRVAYV